MLWILPFRPFKKSQLYELPHCSKEIQHVQQNGPPSCKNPTTQKKDDGTALTPLFHFVSKETKETWWTDPAKCSDACGLWQRTWNADWDGRGPPVGEKMKASGAIRHLYLDSMLRRVLVGIVWAPFCWVGGGCIRRWMWRAGALASSRL